MLYNSQPANTLAHASGTDQLGMCTVHNVKGSCHIVTVPSSRPVVEFKLCVPHPDVLNKVFRFLYMHVMYIQFMKGRDKPAVPGQQLF